MSRRELLMMRVEPEPTWLQRMIGAVRSYTIGPLTSRSPELARYFGGGETSSGITVTEESAVRLSAVFSAIAFISDDVSSLPINLFKRVDGGKTQIFESHPLQRLIKDSPNQEMSSLVFRRTMQAHALLWGNAYAEIERDNMNRPIALWPLLPERVTAKRSRGGVLSYDVHNEGGGTVMLPASDVLHLMGQSHDGIVGNSFIAAARHSIALGLAAEEFGATFYKNGGTLSGVVSNKGPKPTQQAAQGQREADEARYAGVKRAHKWLQLWNDATFTPISVAPDNAQFLETRTFQIREVARWFKMPPHKLGDLADATFSNVEQMESAYYVSCLRPWVVQWEQELGRKLIAASERNIQYFRHSLEGFLRADSAGRAAFYRELFAIGAITINEIRELEELNPIDGGDTTFIPINNVMPLDRVTEYVDALIAEKNRQQQPAPAPAVDAAPAVQEVKASIDAMEARFVDHAARLSAEAARSAAAEMLVAEKAQQVESLRTDLEGLRADLAAKDGAIAAKDQQLREELAAQVGKSAAQVLELQQQWDAERATLDAERARIQAEKNDADVMLGVAEQERQKAQRAVDELRAQLEAARAADLQRDDAHRQAVSAAQRSVDSRLQAMAVAHRALIVDAVSRLLQREADRARKAQATPEKLRAWVESFYSLHADTCRSVLRPVMLAWAATAGANADRALQDVVQAHIDQSRRELLTAADTDDSDELAAALARTLQRWEFERADLVADRLMAEGERYGH